MLTRFVFFLLFLLLAGAAAASNDQSRLDAANAAIESSEEIEQYRGYNECKTIYLRANLDKNKELSKNALECIVKGGKKLGIDVTRYEADQQKSVSDTATSPSVPKETTRNDKISTVFSQITPAVPEKALTPLSAPVKFTTPEPEKLIKPEPAKKSDEISMTMRHRLVDIQWKDAGLELVFDTPLDPNAIRMSKIIEADKQRFRYIVDIDSGTLSRSHNLEHKNINRIQISQYNAKTARLVFEHNHAITVKPVVKGKTVYIDLNVEIPKPTPPLAVAPQEPVVQEPPLVAALPPLITVTPKDRSKKVIVIDPGHGGKDSGAVGNGFMEKEIVLQIGNRLSERLRAMGYTVHMTRSNDTFIELKDRTKFANDKEADLFVSIHANSIPKTSDPKGAQGLETYFLSPGRSERAMRVAAIENSEDMGEMGQYGKLSFLDFINKAKIVESNKLAIDLQKGMLGNLRRQFPNVRDNGVREAPFWVLVGAQMPAVLVEVGYISHPEESARIADEKYQKWIVEGLVEGVGRYFINNG